MSDEPITAEVVEAAVRAATAHSDRSGKEAPPWLRADYQSYIAMEAAIRAADEARGLRKEARLRIVAERDALKEALVDLVDIVEHGLVSSFKQSAIEALSESYERARAVLLLVGAVFEPSEPSHNGIPDSYWREVPCGHPPDPVAMRNAEGTAFCHCGRGLALVGDSGLNIEGAPGEVFHCDKCGCHVAVPSATSEGEPRG